MLCFFFFCDPFNSQTAKHTLSHACAVSVVGGFGSGFASHCWMFWEATSKLSICFAYFLGSRARSTHVDTSAPLRFLVRKEDKCYRKTTALSVIARCDRPVFISPLRVYGVTPLKYRLFFCCCLTSYTCPSPLQGSRRTTAAVGWCPPPPPIIVMTAEELIPTFIGFRANLGIPIFFVPSVLTGTVGME